MMLKNKLIRKFKKCTLCSILLQIRRRAERFKTSIKSKNLGKQHTKKTFVLFKNHFVRQYKQNIKAEFPYVIIVLSPHSLNTVLLITSKKCPFHLKG